MTKGEAEKIKWRWEKKLYSLREFHDVVGIEVPNLNHIEAERIKIRELQSVRVERANLKHYKKSRNCDDEESGHISRIQWSDFHGDGELIAPDPLKLHSPYTPTRTPKTPCFSNRNV